MASREDIAKELARIADKNGGELTPDLVIKTARAESNPLHDCFEWDDTEAANQYRVDQARRLIRSVEVHIVNQRTQISTVAYVRNPEREEDGEQGYISTVSLRNDPARARAVIDQELERVESIMARCEKLAEAFGMKDAVTLTMERVRALRRRLKRSVG